VAVSASAMPGNTGEGNRGQPGSCALKALPYVQAGTLGRALLVTGGVIDGTWGGHCLGEIIADVVMTSL
jgi:hypothetical protein